MALQRAKEKERKAKADLEWRKQLDSGEVTATSPEEEALAAISIKNMEARVHNKSKNRRTKSKELDERKKDRDEKIKLINNEALVKRDNQIYNDNGTYTARWTCLPA